MLAQNRAQFLLDFFLQAEWIEPGQELFQTCDLDWIGLRAGFQTRQGCGRLVVDAPFAAAFTLGAQVLHHWAKEIAKPTPLFAIEIVQLRGHLLRLPAGRSRLTAAHGSNSFAPLARCRFFGRHASG